MRIARRMSDIGTETAFEVSARARALEAQGRDIIHLQIGEPDFCDIVVLNCDVLGVAANHTPITRKLAVGARSFATGTTMAAGAADMVALDSRNAIALSEGAHVAPDVGDGAGDFMTKDARHLDAKF